MPNEVNRSKTLSTDSRGTCCSVNSVWLIGGFVSSSAIGSSSLRTNIDRRVKPKPFAFVNCRQESCATTDSALAFVYRLSSLRFENISATVIMSATVVEENCSRGESRRLKELKYQQVCRLHRVMSEDIRICGRPGSHFPTLVIPVYKLVKIVRTRLAAGCVLVRDVRLNGGAASYVLQNGAEKAEYNDVDLIFRVDISGVENGSERVKEVVLASLHDMLIDHDDFPLPACTGFIENAYVRKMVKVSNKADCWSLISLTNASGHHVELKFVDQMRRQFEFSVDSFQIVLDQLLAFYSSEQPQLDSYSYPKILAESVYGPFEIALLHLNKRLIANASFKINGLQKIICRNFY